MPDLRPQVRARSLTHLEAEIDHAQAMRDQWAARARREEAAGLDSSWARGMLGIADERLEQLRRSIQVLMQGEDGPPADEPGDP